MSFGDVATKAGGGGAQQGEGGLGPLSDRLSLGVAARLSRYLQVLTQARKMGKETISSQELSEYTHVNSTQIRRDLSGFGKFGKRGVGYNVDSLVSQIRKILRTAGQHNIALFGAGPGRQARRRRREDHLQLLGRAAAGAARGDGPHLEPGRRPAVRAVLLPHVARAAMT